MTRNIQNRAYLSIRIHEHNNKNTYKEYKIMWRNVVEPDRPQMTISGMRIACWTAKATDTHSEYVILIAFPLQQWLYERASVLRYTYIACLVLLFHWLYFGIFLFVRLYKQYSIVLVDNGKAV